MKRVIGNFLILLSVIAFTGCNSDVIKDENVSKDIDNAMTEINEELGYRQVDMQEAIRMMKEEDNYVILDVRRLDEFQEKHIPGAINIPNEVIGTEEIPQLQDKDQLILVYCRSGNRSKQASMKLAELGYTNIVEFGGIIDWPGEVVSDLN